MVEVLKRMFLVETLKALVVMLLYYHTVMLYTYTTYRSFTTFATFTVFTALLFAYIICNQRISVTLIQNTFMYYRMR